MIITIELIVDPIIQEAERLHQPTHRNIHRMTALVTLLACLFFLFFQVNKGEPFGAVNPFAQDPYDAVGSIAVQATLLIGILSYARALHLREDPSQAFKSLLILRGDALVLLAIWLTLIADAIALIVQPVSLTRWGFVLIWEVALMFLFTTLCTVLLVLLARRMQKQLLPEGLTPADAIDDLWALLRIPANRLQNRLPGGVVVWVNQVNSDRLFARIRWVDPRLHPWRFVGITGLLVGIGLLLAQFAIEGLPPSLLAGLLVVGIFISVEVCAALVGFAVLGGYLGLLTPSPLPHL